MRKAPAILTNTHRIARLTAWLVLWVRGCFWAMCAGLADGDIRRRRELDKMARAVCTIVVFNAASRARAIGRRSLHRHGRLGRLHRRAIIGSRLRKSARGRDFAARLCAVLALVRDMERHIKTAARRLARGFTRLRILDPTPEAAPVLRPAPHGAIACADTS
jgi:hypothetical protein